MPQTYCKSTLSWNSATNSTSGEVRLVGATPLELIDS
ncbi:hypothetical protein Cva_00121 [Caedimonas varicaedens]|uniref:Uncharacterized protein n=1 Tax=Caedimonas varicaedens TaxID=1629334 RepID=A0A0K8MC96_9PROT|nr:hypothetical protein Cva_00121 [Caedimonas varicaedens]